MSSELFEGCYLFHLHTTLTDSSLTTSEYFEFAAAASVDRLIFLEHIRRTPTYDAAALAREVSEHSSRYGLLASLGFEAKLLPDGTIDIDDSALQLAEVIGIAEHGFPDNERLLVSAFFKAINRCSEATPRKTYVWVHPGLWFLRHRRPPDAEPAYLDMVACATEAGVLLERNLRYGLLSEKSVLSFPMHMTVLGADTHSRKDLDRWRNLRSGRACQ